MPELPQDPYIAYIHRFFDRWLPVYDLFALSIAPAYNAMARRVAPRPGLEVLDLATGTGEIALRLARRGADVLGVDITPGMLDKARAKAHAKAHRLEAPPRFEQMDARHLSLADRSVDVVSISFALHDMPRRVRLEVLAEAARVARQRIVVLDYDLPRARPAHWLWLTSIRLFETAYFPGFAAEGGEALFAEAGLEAVTAYPMRILPFTVWEIVV